MNRLTKQIKKKSEQKQHALLAKMSKRQINPPNYKKPEVGLKSLPWFGLAAEG